MGEDRYPGHWSRPRTFVVHARVRLKPTAPGPIDAWDLAPLERLFGTRLDLTLEILQEIRRLGEGLDAWLRQNPSHLQILIDDADAGIERAVGAGLAAPMSEELRGALERAAREATPPPVRAGAVVDTTIVAFGEEGDVGPS